MVFVFKMYIYSIKDSDLKTVFKQVTFQFVTISYVHQNNHELMFSISKYILSKPSITYAITWYLHYN